MTLSPSVEQLFSLSSSSASSDADSSIKSQPVMKKTKPSPRVAAKKSSNTKYTNTTNTTNRNNSKVRASSLSPTKTASTPNSSKYITINNNNNNKNTGFKQPRSGPAFGNGGRTPPRSPKPRSQRGASTSSSCTHKSSTAMTKNNNNTSYENHSDSSTSVSSKSSKGYVKLATLTTSEESSRVRNSQSFSMVPKKNDDLFAGSAASPDATALPQPPKAWLIDFDNKRTMMTSTFITDAATTTGSFKENRARNFSAPIKPTTTTTPPPPANVQKFFASFTLVSTTA